MTDGYDGYDRYDGYDGYAGYAGYDGCAGYVGRALAALVLLFLGLAPVAARTEQVGAPKPAERIVSLVPAVTEMLFAIGAGDEVVGVSSFDRYPPEAAARPRVGALVDPDVERILSLRPTLVVVYGTQEELIARLERAGIARFPYEHAGLADVTTTIRALGRRIGREADAARVAAAIEADLDAVRRRVAGRRRPRTALILGRETGTLRGMYASAGVGFLHDLLELAGAEDAFADVARQNLQVSAEVMLARAPEAILELRPSNGWTPARIEAELAAWRALPSIPAVRTARLYLLADDVLLVPGPRIAEAARLVAGVLHPQ